MLAYVAFLDVGEGRLTLDDFGAHHVEVLDGVEHLDTFFELMSNAFGAAPSPIGS